MAARFRLARRRAEELITAVGITEVPVALDRIAKHLNASVQYKPFDGDLSGLMRRNPDGTAIIGINVSHPLTRRRFTLAHEIAHLVLHSDEKLHVDSSFPVAFRNESSGLGTDDLEIEANQFAAALLMPEEFLRRDIIEADHTNDFEDVIGTLARRYRVSAQAMGIRLNALGLLA